MLAAVAASLLGLKIGAAGLSGAFDFLSQDNSRGYKCCIALYRIPLPVRNFAARIILSPPLISSTTIQIFQ